MSSLLTLQEQLEGRGYAEAVRPSDLHELYVQLRTLFGLTDPGLQMYKLAADSSPGDSALVLDREPGPEMIDGLGYLVVDPFTTDCELRRVSSVDRETNTVTVATAVSIASTDVEFLDAPFRIESFSAPLGALLHGTRFQVSGAAESFNNRTFTIQSISGSVSLEVLEDVIPEAAGASVTLSVNLQHAHHTGDTVLWWSGGWLPLALYGVKADGLEASAAENRAGWNRAMNDSKWVGRYGGFVHEGGPGQEIVTDGVLYFDDRPIVGFGKGPHVKVHSTGFDFTDEPATLTGRDPDGIPYEATGGNVSPSWLRNLIVDGNGVANASGIIGCPESCEWENVGGDDLDGYTIRLPVFNSFRLAKPKVTAYGDFGIVVGDGSIEIDSPDLNEAGTGGIGIDLQNTSDAGAVCAITGVARVKYGGTAIKISQAKSLSIADIDVTPVGGAAKFLDVVAQTPDPVYSIGRARFAATTGGAIDDANQGWAFVPTDFPVASGDNIIEQFHSGVGGVMVGGKDRLVKRLVGSATYNPPSVAQGSHWATTVTVTGATVAKSVAHASHSSITADGWALYASVTAADTVTVSGHNRTGGTVDLASGTLFVVVEVFG